MQPHEISKRFTAHTINSEQATRIDAIRAEFKQFAQDLAAILPEGREESLVMTHLETASFYAVAAVAREPRI